MLWLTTVNPIFNKDTQERLLRKKKEIWGGGGGDDVEKVGRTSEKILATPLRV